MATIGTCSKCRGPVTVPDAWHGVVPPTPSCSRCGATPKAAFGPVIEMDGGLDDLMNGHYGDRINVPIWTC